MILENKILKRWESGETFLYVFLDENKEIIYNSILHISKKMFDKHPAPISCMRIRKNVYKNWGSIEHPELENVIVTGGILIDVDGEVVGKERGLMFKLFGKSSVSNNIAHPTTCLYPRGSLAIHA